MWKVLFLRKSLTGSLSEIVTKLPQDKMTEVSGTLIYLMGQVGEMDRKTPGLLRFQERMQTQEAPTTPQAQPVNVQDTGCATHNRM